MCATAQTRTFAPVTLGTNEHANHTKLLFAIIGLAIHIQGEPWPAFILCQQLSACQFFYLELP